MELVCEGETVGQNLFEDTKMRNPYLEPLVFACWNVIKLCATLYVLHLWVYCSQHSHVPISRGVLEHTTWSTEYF